MWHRMELTTAKITQRGKAVVRQKHSDDRSEPKAIIEYLRNPDDWGIGHREKRGNFAQLSAVNIWCRQMAMVFGADWRSIGSRL